MELKYLTFGFKSDKVTDEGKIEGYASTFGNVDLGLDVVDKGAFTKTIKESKGKIPILADHDPREQLGWNQSAGEDNKGLWVEGQLNMKVQKAVERHSLAKQAHEIGANAGLSIGYYTIKAEPDSQQPRIRRLKELKLVEYSFVTFPMNTMAMVSAAKHLNCVDKAQMLIQQLKKEGVSLSDFETALRKEAASHDFDPVKVSQSMDNLLLKFKS